jgi:hypothetical protein
VSSRRAGRRGTRSSSERTGRVTYYCTGGAGKDKAGAHAAATGLTSLPDGGHGPVTNLERPGPGQLRCPLCGVTRPVGYRARRQIAGAGLTEVDISLP